MTRAFVVVNPVAGGGRTRRLWPALREHLHRLDLAFDWAETDGPGAATGLARRAVDQGARLVVAVGGDGTVQEVVNGLVAPAAESAAVLGIVPTGRGRDTCRNLGLPTEPRAAARRLVDGRDEPVDVGVAEGADGLPRCFLTAAGAGFDATVAARARTARGPGTLSYLAAVVRALLVHRPVPARIAVDGEPAWSGRLTAAVVANGPHFGGGMRIAPAADPTDGRLDLVVLGDLGRLELLGWLPAVYRGRHLAHPRVAARRGRAIAIEATSPLPVHVDGEEAGRTPVTVRVCPAALRLRR